MAKQIVEMVVESVKNESPDTKSVRLRWPEGYDVEFKTGQFITIYWPEAPHYKRAYSLSSCALDRGYYEVTVKREGKMGTRLVDWAMVGNRLCVIPPTGRFLPIYEPDAHLICVAGGSGVTPFRGFMREAALRKLSTRITVLYSVRAPEEVIFHQDFDTLVAENPQFKFLVTCTRLPEGHSWMGHRGRINAAWLQEQIVDREHTFFYACGPNALVEGTRKIVCDELLFPKAQMHLEKWG
ncbi:MAG: ferredoxin--NADP reductase [Verrucomicrobiota bacterium]